MTQPVNVSLSPKGADVTLNGTNVTITPGGDVTVFTAKDVEVAAAAPAKNTGNTVNVSDDFNSVAAYGARVEATQNGLVVSTAGRVQIKEPVAADVSATAQNTFTPGTKMQDGTVYAGLTADGSALVFALPQDLEGPMTFNAATKALDKLNKKKTLGYSDWQLPDVATLKTLQSAQNDGALQGTFNRTDKGNADGYAGWYWSSTVTPQPNFVRFAYGLQGKDAKNGQKLSARPVRLVQAAK